MTTLDGPVPTLSKEVADRLLAESTSKVHEGRAYDYYLGGNSNYAVDRAFAQEQIARLPDIPWAARQNRRFLRRAVQHMINQGIRQFVDIGSGLPTEGNVHQLAEQYAPGECRVVYIDHDPVASAHGYLLLQAGGQLARNRPINGDVLDHRRLWQAILDTGLIDLDRPVGLLLVALLHFVADDALANESVAYYRDKVPPGSQLAISHASVDGMPQAAIEALQAVLKNYKRATSSAHARDRAQVKEFFGDWTLLDPPGIAWTPDWSPEGLEEDSIVGDVESYRSQVIAGLATKP
ncbi:SAM-dependent methyltransferase [Amycolatopsis minnesotensis]